MLRNQDVNLTKEENTVPLNKDLLSHTLFGYLDTKSAAGVATTYSLEKQSPYNKSVELYTLQAVTESNQEDAEIILKASPSLSLVRSTITDHAKRTFSNISPLQYTYWALDFRMAKMMVTHLSPEEKMVALEQLNEIDNQGVEYILELNNRELTANEWVWQTKEPAITSLRSEKHFDLKAFEMAYDTFCANNHIEEYWLPVGSEQRRFPSHFLQEYCRVGNNNDPLPYTFNAWDYENERLVSCFPSIENKGLGYEYTLFRLSSGEPCVLSENNCPSIKVNQVAVLKALHQTRMMQFNALKNELENEVNLLQTAKSQLRK